MFGKKHSLGKMWIEDYRVFTLYLFSNKTVPWHTNEDLIMVPLIQQTIDIKLLRRMLPPNLFVGDYFIHMKKFVCLSYWLLRWVELIKCQFCCVGVDISTLENSRYVHYSLQLNGVENISSFYYGPYWPMPVLRAACTWMSGSPLKCSMNR